MDILLRNNLQLPLILALVALVGFPAYAMADTPTTISLEKEIKRVDPFLDKLNELESKKMKAASDKERMALQAAQDEIIRHAKSLQREVSPERIEDGYAKASVLVDKILEKKDGNNQFVHGAENFVPFTEIAYYSGEDAIKVGIHEDYVNSANMEEYADIVRGIVGDGVNIIIYNGGGYGHFDSCDTRTSDCSPMQAGIQIGIDLGTDPPSSYVCTLGFPATLNGSAGFITAGHCFNGFDVGRAVDQSLNRKVGELVIETFDLGSSEENCDCAFVKLTEGITLDNTVFGISPKYYPDHVGTVSVHDYVKMVGYKSGIKIGKVITINATAPINGTNGIITTLINVVKADYGAIIGDSGAPIIEAFVASPAFLGTNSAKLDGFTYYFPYTNFESELTGITWGLNATQTPIAFVQNNFSTKESQQVVLDGASSYGLPLGTQIANYTWTQQPTGAPDVTFPNAADKHTKYPTVTVPNVSDTELIVISLEVTDEYGVVSRNSERLVITVEDSGASEFVPNPYATDEDEFGYALDILSSSDIAVGAPRKHVTIPASPLHAMFGYDLNTNHRGNFEFITDDVSQSATIRDLNSGKIITISNNTDDDFIFTYAGSESSSVVPILNITNDIKTALANYINISLTNYNNNTSDIIHISVQIPQELGLSSEQLIANHDDSEYDDSRYIILINENADVAHLYDAESLAFLASEIRDTGGAYLINSNGVMTLTIENPTPESNENFGDDIQHIGNNNILISVPRDKILIDGHPSQVGAVYIFDGNQIGTTNTAILTIENPDPNPYAGDKFGDDTAVSDNGHKIVVGVPQDYDPKKDEVVGTAYIFDGDQIGTINTPLLDITSPNPDKGDKFGDAVAITSNHLVAVGSPFDSSVSAGGAVYIFDGNQTGTTNSTTLVIKNPDPTVGDEFGYSLAVMNGDMLIVGAPKDDSSGLNTGSVYVFNATLTGTTNTNSTLLEINNPYDSTNDGFGKSLYSNGDLIFIGAPDKTVNGIIEAGAVYVYDGRLRGTIHEPLFILNNNSTTIYDNYGESISVSGTSYAVGIPNDDRAGTNTGAMFSFLSNLVLPTTPDSPTGLNATALSDSIIHLEWNEPLDNGGYQIRDYTIEYKESISNTWIVFDDGMNMGTTTVVSELADNTSYDFRVSAKNDLDVGTSSNTVTETTMLVSQTVPDAPTVLLATAISPTQIDMSWYAPVNNGSSLVTGYHIERNLNGIGFATLVNDTNSTSVRHTDGTLSANSTAMYRVSAINAVGTGNQSNVTEATTLSPTIFQFTGIIRDFNDTHPNMQRGCSPGCQIHTGIVGPLGSSLDVDGKPVFYDKGNDGTLTNANDFNQWYRTVNGTNTEQPFTIQLEPLENDSSIYSYSSGYGFFPIDNEMFGNQGRAHNYHFTIEFHSTFAFDSPINSTNQSFTFKGDDDVWVYVNGTLVLDIGGVHPTKTRTFTATQLMEEPFNLLPDTIYDLDLFFAERQTVQSNFRIDTTINFDPFTLGTTGDNLQNSTFVQRVVDISSFRNSDRSSDDVSFYETNSTISVENSVVRIDLPADLIIQKVTSIDDGNNTNDDLIVITESDRIPDSGVITESIAGSLIDIGDPFHEMIFNKAVKVTLFNQAGNSAFYIDSDNVTHLILLCAGILDFDAATDYLSTNEIRECYHNSGNDLVIWTTHFTIFGLSSSGSSSPSSSSDGSSSSSRGAPSESIPPSFTTSFDKGTETISINGVGIAPKLFRTDYVMDDSVSVQTGNAVSIALTLYDDSSWEHIAHLELCLNKQTSNNRICDSDTKIVWDKNKPDLEIVDPNELISDASINITEVNPHVATFDYAITFAHPMDTSDVQIYSWDTKRNALTFTIGNALTVTQGTTAIITTTQSALYDDSPPDAIILENIVSCDTGQILLDDGTTCMDHEPEESMIEPRLSSSSKTEHPKSNDDNNSKVTDIFTTPSLSSSSSVNQPLQQQQISSIIFAPEPTCGLGTENIDGFCQVIRTESETNAPEPTCGLGTENIDGFCQVIRTETNQQARSLQDTLNETFRMFLDLLMNK